MLASYVVEKDERVNIVAMYGEGRGATPMFSDEEDVNLEAQFDLEARLENELGMSDNQESARDMEENGSESEEYDALGAQNIFAEAASRMTAEHDSRTSGRQFPDHISDTCSLSSMPSVGAVEGQE